MNKSLTNKRYLKQAVIHISHERGDRDELSKILMNLRNIDANLGDEITAIILSCFLNDF